MCKNEVARMAAEVKGQNLSDAGNTFSKRTRPTLTLRLLPSATGNHFSTVSMSLTWFFFLFVCLFVCF